MLAGDVMTQEVISVASDASAMQAGAQIRRMAAGQQSCWWQSRPA